MLKTDLIEKIKKLIALSLDQSTTESERSNALSRASKLMAQYSIEECDLGNSNAVPLICQERLILSLTNPLPVFLTTPAVLSSMVSKVAENFGCYTYFNGTGVHLMGFKVNIEIATYSINVILNQGIRDYREEYRKNKSTSFGTSFWLGFQDGLNKRFTKINYTEMGITVYDKVKKEFDSLVRVVNYDPINSTASGFNAGNKSAKEASLVTGLSNSSNQGRRLT